MTVRENLRHLIEALPEDRLNEVLDYLADFQDEHAELAPETEQAVAEGLADLAQGRVLSLDEYRRSRNL